MNTHRQRLYTTEHSHNPLTGQSDPCQNPFTGQAGASYASLIGRIP